jgi:hypothetical protein
MLQKIADFWGLLPAEVKVAIYIASSYGLSEVIVQLGKLNVSNVWLAIGINIVLVFLREIKPRVERMQDK